MRLYDTRKDYYDVVLHSAYPDSTPVWRRALVEYEVKVSPGGSSFGGVHDPAIQLQKRAGDAVNVYNNMYRHGRVGGDTVFHTLLLICGTAHLVLYRNNFVRGAYGSGTQVLSFRPSELGIPFPDEGLAIGAEIHRQYSSPLIELTRVPKTGNPLVRVNPILADPRTRKADEAQGKFRALLIPPMFPAVQLAQQIEMYLSNELASGADPAPYTTGGDVVVRDAKGFDEWSFKRHPSQNKPRKQRK